MKEPTDWTWLQHWMGPVLQLPAAMAAGVAATEVARRAATEKAATRANMLDKRRVVWLMSSDCGE